MHDNSRIWNGLLGTVGRPYHDHLWPVGLYAKALSHGPSRTNVLFRSEIGNEPGLTGLEKSYGTFV